MKNLAGKVALVTGAGSGIGRATAVALAKEGARLAVTDIDPGAAAATADSIRDQGGIAQHWMLDVADPDSIGQAIGQVRASMGLPAILVNNAGIAVGGYFQDCSRESWERVVAINLMGVVHCSRALVPKMIDSGQPGHVVNIASILGQVGIQGVSAYCMTKFGVVGFSESLRAELAQYGIGVSTICPGMIRTNIIRSGVLESAEEDLQTRRQGIEKLFEKRNYPPERVARAIVKAIRRNRGVVPVAPEAWVGHYLKRISPWLVYRLARLVKA